MTLHVPDYDCSKSSLCVTRDPPVIAGLSLSRMFELLNLLVRKITLTFLQFQNPAILEGQRQLMAKSLPSVNDGLAGRSSSVASEPGRRERSALQQSVQWHPLLCLAASLCS